VLSYGMLTKVLVMAPLRSVAAPHSCSCPVRPCLISATWPGPHAGRPGFALTRASATRHAIDFRLSVKVERGLYDQPEWMHLSNLSYPKCGNLVRHTNGNALLLQADTRFTTPVFWNANEGATNGPLPTSRFASIPKIY
jgi:hypothetical protein